MRLITLRLSSVQGSVCDLRSTKLVWDNGLAVNWIELRLESSRFSAIAFEKPAKSLFAANLRKRNGHRLARIRLCPLRLQDQVIIEPLVRPFFVIVLDEFTAKDVHVLATKDDEMIKTFLLDRLNESFGECDHVRRSDRSSLGFDLPCFKGIHEWLRVLAVIVEHQDLAFRASRLGRLNKSIRLLNHPLLVRLVGRRRDINATRFDVDKDQNKDVSKARFRNDFL